MIAYEQRCLDCLICNIPKDTEEYSSAISTKIMVGLQKNCFKYGFMENKVNILNVEIDNISRMTDSSYVAKNFYNICKFKNPLNEEEAVFYTHASITFLTSKELYHLYASDKKRFDRCMNTFILAVDDE